MSPTLGIGEGQYGREGLKASCVPIISNGRLPLLSWRGRKSLVRDQQCLTVLTESGCTPKQCGRPADDIAPNRGRIEAGRSTDSLPFRLGLRRE